MLKASSSQGWGGRFTPTLTIEERFWRFVDRRSSSECWPWLGGITAKGYGSFHVSENGRKRVITASRAI